MSAVIDLVIDIPDWEVCAIFHRCLRRMEALRGRSYQGRIDRGRSDVGYDRYGRCGVEAGETIGLEAAVWKMIGE